MSETHLTETRFDEFELEDSIRRGIEASGFQFCTPIQAETIPVALQGHDLAGQAQTGTGKTAAFLVVCLQRLLTLAPRDTRKPNQPRALILAPTRELAIQIHKDAKTLTQFTDLKLNLVYGGVDYEKQRTELSEGVDILIGTPGRIIDYFKQKVFDLQEIDVMVLDEADRMFDLGFIKDIRFLLRRMPKPEKRLNMLFSATLSFRVMELAYEHMNSPQKIVIESEDITADQVEQSIYFPSNNDKISLLIHLFQTLQPVRSIVFVNTKHVANRITRWLDANELPSALLSGDVPQKKRQRLLNEFKEGKFCALVATDVAARGIHIDGVTHVFNYDLPQSGEDYVHRIGRTARAGASGNAISFACEDTSFYLPDIESYIEMSIPVSSFSTSDFPSLIKPAPMKRKTPHSAGRKHPPRRRR